MQKNIRVGQNNRSLLRRPSGAIYTACLASLIIPFFLALSDTILQAALSFYNQQRISYVANDVIEHFETVQQLESRTFDPLFLNLALANGLHLKNIKTEISSAAQNLADSETAIQIKISGRCENALGLFSWYRPFHSVHIVKLSQFETLGYSAINAYPFCEPEPARGLSAYLPIYRPSPTLPTWSFTQDNAIGSVRKSTSDPSAIDDRQASNWQQVACDLLSIY